MRRGVTAIPDRMEIIPVLDLKGGTVVHAKQGQRDTYRAIHSRLCATSTATDVLAALLRLHRFQNVYIADLDAIERTGEHSAVIAELARRHSAVEFWIDNGNPATITDPKHHNVRHVLGSESMSAAESLQTIARTVILSLDFRGADFLGPPALLENSSFWPGRVIAMTLARVGGGDGPDLERLASVQQRAGARRVYAAGGVRGRADLEALSQAGAAGVLVASALHDGRLTPADLADFA
jgi:phosphoribosylformimino-5-aminoimidazole carboxamide ribotide isomerase